MPSAIAATPTTASTMKVILRLILLPAICYLLTHQNRLISCTLAPVKGDSNRQTPPEQV
jgi:hypothetical protein